MANNNKSAEMDVGDGGVMRNGGGNFSRSLRRAASQAFWDGMEARFMERCKVGLCLGEKMLLRVSRFFEDSKPLLLANIDTFGTGSVEEAERLWNACTLYAVKMLSSATCVGEDADAVEGGAAAGFTLTQLLRETKISVMDLFKELPQFLVKAAPTLEALYGDSWEKHLQVRFLSSGSCGSMEVILPWINGFEITTCILPVGAGPGEGSASQYCPCDSSLQLLQSSV
jgi:hypothetical protein